MIWEYGWVWGWIGLAWVVIVVGGKVRGSREEMGRWGWELWYVGIGWIYLLLDNSSIK
jgi:hypothetical protein